MIGEAVCICDVGLGWYCQADRTAVTMCSNKPDRSRPWNRLCWDQLEKITNIIHPVVIAHIEIAPPFLVRGRNRAGRY